MSAVKSLQRTLVLGLGLILALSACTEKTYGPDKPAAPIESSDRVIVPQSTSDLLANSEMTDLQSQLESFESILDEADRSPEHYDRVINEVLEPATDLVLNPQALTKREFTDSQNGFRAVRALHKAIVQIAAVDPSHLALKKTYVQYEQLVLRPCNVANSSCSALKFAARDANYGFVIMNLAKQLPLDPKTRWTYLTFGLDFAVLPNSPAFAQFALDSMTNYGRWLAAQPHDKIVDEVKTFKKFASQLTITLSSRGTIVKDYLDKIDIWSVEEDQSVFRSVMRDSLMSFLITDYAIVKGQPTQSFRRFLDSNVETFNTEVMGQFIDNPEKGTAAKETWKRAYQMFNIGDPSKIDRTLLFVFDQLFNNKLGQSNALLLLLNQQIDSNQLLDSAQIYVQIQFARIMMASHENLGPKLKDPAMYGSLERLQRQLGKADLIENEWTKYRTGISALNDMMRALPEQNGQQFNESQRNRMEQIFGTQKANTKWFAIYPNMLPVMYFISKANFNDTIRILWWVFDLTSDIIILDLFEGRMGMWFNFTGSLYDGDFLTTPELLLTFRNAVLSGVFESYGIPVSEFLFEVVSRLLDPVSAKLDFFTNEFYQDFLVEATVQTGTSINRNYFTRAHRFCEGDPRVREEIELVDLDKTLAPFANDLNSGYVNSGQTLNSDFLRLYLHTEKWGSQLKSLTVMDYLRTDYLSYLDLVDKMLSMYQDYLQAAGLEDPGLSRVEDKVELVHRKVRKLYGMFFQTTRRYYSCREKQTALFRDRIVQTMKYEKVYAKQAFADLKRVEQNPALLSNINASYQKPMPMLPNVMTQDRIIEVAGGARYFAFFKGDFIMRVRGYMLNGTDLPNGEKLPALAPRMNIIMPNSTTILEDSDTTYEFLFSNKQHQAIEYRPGMTEDQFVGEYFKAAFYMNGNDNTEGLARSNLGTFNQWGNRLTGIGGMLSDNLLLVGSLIKAGKVDGYDFDRRGCSYDLPFESLDQNCRTTHQIAAEEPLRIQLAALDKVNLTPELQELFTLTGSQLVEGRTSLRSVFFTKYPDYEKMGILDGFRWVLGHDGLGEDLHFPGELGCDSHSGTSCHYPHKGNLGRAKNYYKDVVQKGEPLFHPPPELSGQLAEMYQGYVDREWEPIAKLEELAAREEAAGRGTYSLKLILSYKPFVLPMFTGYSNPLEQLQKTFDGETQGYFSRGRYQARDFTPAPQ